MTLALDLLGGFSTRPPLRLGSHKAEALLAFLALTVARSMRWTAGKIDMVDDVHNGDARL
jgi:hypothetical protein